MLAAEPPIHAESLADAATLTIPTVTHAEEWGLLGWMFGGVWVRK